TGPGWPHTLFVINYDEWGGFFEHVPPPAGPVTTTEQQLGYTDGLRGFRVPCVVVSPWSQHPRVSRTVYDHTSILKLIEWRHRLQPLSVRDAAANNLAHVLDFEHPRLSVPQANIAPGPFGSPCVSTDAAAAPTALQAAAADDALLEWLPLRDVAMSHGWP